MSNEDSSRAAYLEALVSLLQGNQAQTIRELAAVCQKYIFHDLSISDRVFSALFRLFGTTSLEGLYIVDNLMKAMNVDGDICEFGVAQGRTSALLAAVLLDHGSTKTLWLYDSFEGLPAPSEKDLLITDIFGLGSIAAYEGLLNIPETEVLHELAGVGFPAERCVICKGWVEDQLKAGKHPERIAFAYLDMDFFQSTADALEMLTTRMPTGGTVVVDDYGFFSSGVETAVRETMIKYPGAYRLEHPFGFKFAVLHKM